MTGWWRASNIFGIFIPKPWGFMIQFDVHIFQMGWILLSQMSNEKQQKVPGKHRLSGILIFSWNDEAFLAIFCARVDQLLILAMVILPVIGNPCNGRIDPHYWVDIHPLPQENNGCVDPSTNEELKNNWLFRVYFCALRIIGPSKLAILMTLTLLYRFKPFHWRDQDP